MTSFSSCIQDTKSAVRSWSGFGDLASVTILRDARGKIRLFLECKAGVAEAAFKGLLPALDHILTAQLGSYWGKKIYENSGNLNALEAELFNRVNAERKTDETESGGLNWYMIEKSVAKKAWIECSGSQKPVWKFEDACRNVHPKVVTFYSFKGGMGRTTSMAAVMLCLASQGKNVLAIDTDIEAPGLASLFLQDTAIRKGTIDYLLEKAIGEQPAMSDYICPVTDATLMDGFAGQIYMIPAGKQDDHYLEKLSRIDCQEIKDGKLKSGLESLLNCAVDELKAGSITIDYILLDARAGFHDLGGIVTTQIPHGVVLFGKDSKQSWNGLKQVVKAITYAQSSADPLCLAIVDSGCGTSGMVTQEEKKAFLDGSFEIFEAYYMQRDGGILPSNAAVDVHTPIYAPYQPLLGQDVQLYLGASTGDALMQYRTILLGEPYRQLSDRMMSWFDE